MARLGGEADANLSAASGPCLGSVREWQNGLGESMSGGVFALGQAGEAGAARDDARDRAGDSEGRGVDS